MALLCGPSAARVAGPSHTLRDASSDPAALAECSLADLA